ncbi:polyketide synthase Pks13 [Tsukamurella sp. 8F]|uniref:polyketide synthase Pks13 n=1 Tax=unclassified Tsukamurella TaxID=2633480 RepID=UPI0023B9378E|nr:MULTISPECIES: polyketide synthase Pks13 [unclassified Tsukamurella]MDF0530779.1 polyketide synthase Pks13 [Tsukamurella sp. 8J]MDF0588305.1 polyketide synthase Pks13 [Tsukamurella sp. 8F]
MAENDNSIPKSNEDLTVEELRAWMRNWIAEATKQPVENITDDKSLDEFGLGSRDAVSMASDIEDFTGVTVTATMAFQHPTIALLAQRIVDGEPEVSDDDLAAEAARYDRGEEFEAARGTHDVAVVGLATRFPHAGETPESTWEFLIGGGDGTSELPEDRWVEFKQDPRLKAVLDDANTQGGYLDDVASFDAEFFLMTPREVEMVDPQQRLALELTWEALEQAHIPASSVKGTRTGVWMGSSANDYQMLTVADPSKSNAYALTGTSTSIVANRVSYFYDFHGPSVTIDTACSSSLVAIHQALRSLRDGETDMAVAGGVNMLIVPAATLGFDSVGAQAANGKIKAFSSDADGMIRAEGGGVVLLKRLADAERDGDEVLGVISGSAVTSDGKSNGLFAPNPEAQVTNLRDAYVDAGIDPRTVDYLEAHGTGTLLGDPLEADAVGRVLGRGRDAEKPLLMGSVKTNFGHMEAAAGVAGVAKVLLAMKNGEIPASLNYAGPNPYIQFEANRMLVAGRNVAWPQYSGHKVAGVTGNGFGGTNAHVVLREYTGPVSEEVPATEGSEASADGTPAAAVPEFYAAAAEGATVPLVLSGYVPSRRRAAAGDLADWLETDEARGYSLAEIGRSLAHRSHNRVRSVVMAKTHDDAIKGFRAIADGRNSPLVISANEPDTAGPAFIFSGFGSHHRKMAKQLYLENPIFKYYFDQVNELIIDEAGDDYAEMLVDDSVTYHIETGQVGIFAIQVALVGLFRHHGIEPGVVLPHSMGEATAAWLTGGLSLEDAVRVICNRSRLMGEGEAMLPEEMERFMALVEYSAADIDTVLGEYDGLEICVYAAPTHTVIGGPGKVIDQIVAETEAKGLMARKLVTRGASHTSQMDPLLGELQAELMGVEPHPLKYPMYSTVNKDQFYRAGHPPVHDVDYWIKGLRHSVWFTQAVEKAVEDGYRTFVEFSPNPITLISVAAVTFGNGIQDAALVQTLKRKEDEPGTILTALATVYSRGHDLDVASLFGPGRYAPIPRTRFQRKPIWIDTKLPEGGSGSVPGSHVALPDGRHVWQLEAAALTLGDRTEVSLVDLARIAAGQVLDGAAVTAAVEHGSPQSGETLTTTLTPHPGGASIQVHENLGAANGSNAATAVFRLLLDAVVVGGEGAGSIAEPKITKAAPPVAAAGVAVAGDEPEITVSEEAPAPVEGASERWDSASGESVEHRLGTIISETMGFELEDLPKEIPLIDLGMDSLIAMRIKNRTEYEFDIPPIQIQAVREASFNDVVEFVEYAVTHRDQVDALAEHQAGKDGEVADAAQLAELMKAAKAEAAAKKDAPAAEPESVEPSAAAPEPAADSEVSATKVDSADVDVMDQAAVADAADVGVPPRDAAERLTFATYAIVVGASPGGVFNELPVLAEEVAQKLTARLTERAGGGEIDIEDIIDSKNIEEMSGYVREQMDDATPVEGFVRTLRKPESSDRKPLFLFHPAGGNTMAYEALLRKLPEDLPIYGLERVEGSIEERCRQYLPRIKELQPEGPYYMAGWSLGGALAYGTARLLQSEGAEIAYLGLLDVVGPTVPLTDEPDEKRARLERWEAFARKNYDIPADIELPMDRLLEADDEGQIRILMELAQLSDKKISGAMVEHQRTSFIDNRALLKLNPADYGRFEGTVTLYRADRMHDGAIELEPAFAEVAPDGGWGEVAEKLDLVKVGGDHLQIIDEPYIGKVATHMSEALDRARTDKR